MALATPPVVTRLSPGEIICLYLAVSEEAVSVFLIKEPNSNHSQVYLILNALDGPKTLLRKHLSQ